MEYRLQAEGVAFAVFRLKAVLQTSLLIEPLPVARGLPVVAFALHLYFILAVRRCTCTLAVHKMLCVCTEK